MSLLFLDGMDHCSGLQVHMKYDRVTWQLAGVDESVTGGRFNGQTLILHTLTGTMQLGMSTAVVSKLITGLGINTQSVAGNSVALLQLLWSGTRQIAAHYTASKTLVLFCGSAGAVASSGSAVLGLTSAWNWVEMEGYWHASVGSCTVYVSDVPVVSFTGDTTNGAGASGMNQVDWRVPLSGGLVYMYFDDFYVLDDQGSANTTRVGSTARIRTVYPSADVTVSMTPLTGASNWPMVDETGQWDGAVTYVHASAASTYDLYGLGSVVGSWSANEVPRGVQVVATALTISGTATIAVQLVLSGVTSRTASQTLSTAFTQAHRLVGDTTPGGSAWAVSLMSAIQIGAGYA